MPYSPLITTADSSTFPPPPPTWNYVNLVDPNELGDDLARYPIVCIGPYTYTGM